MPHEEASSTLRADTCAPVSVKKVMATLRGPIAQGISKSLFEFLVSLLIKSHPSSPSSPTGDEEKGFPPSFLFLYLLREEM